MRKINWDIKSPTPNLIQNTNDIKYAFIQEDSSIGYHNISCKDYFQELFMYLLFDKYKEQYQYGFDISSVLFQKYQNLPYYEIAIKSSGDYKINTSLAKITEFHNEFVTNFPQYEDFWTFELAEDDILIVKFKSEYLSLLYLPSFVLGKLRELITTYSEGILFTNWISILNFIDKNKPKVLAEYAKMTISDCHNNSGFKKSFDFLSYPTTLVAVYGTLRKGFGNHRFLSNTAYLYTTESIIRTNTMREYGLMYNLGSFPGIKFHSINDGNYNKYKKYKIVFEVYAVDDETLADLDRLEGYRASEPTKGLYNKQKVAIGGVPCWVYIYNHAVNEDSLITTGDFKNKNEEKKVISPATAD